MKNTTLCYIEKDGAYLMLHRVKKKNDYNHDKWIGVGGHCEENESPYACMMREIGEETGLTPLALTPRGIVTFVNDDTEGEYMHLYTCSSFTGTLLPCDEGELEWVDMARIPELPIWEGDKIFLGLLAAEEPFFSLKLSYRGDTLVYAALNGSVLEPPD